MSGTQEAGKQVIPLSEALEKLARLEQENKLAEADDLANRMLAAMPEHPHILHLAGIVAYRNGRVEQALERMEKAEAISPDMALYPRNMCEVYRGAGRLEDALRAGKRAVELAPNDLRAYFNLALIHYERLELDESVRLLRAGDRAGPGLCRGAFREGRGAAAGRKDAGRLGQL